MTRRTYQSSISGGSGKHRSVMATMTVIIAGMVYAATLLSCSGDNTIGDLSGPVTDTVTVTVRDTLYADTLRLHDTTEVTKVQVETVHDTSFLPVGEQEILYFGLIYDVSDMLDEPSAPFDSVYASLTSYARPRRPDLRVSVNSTEVRYDSTQGTYAIGSASRGLAEGTFQFIDMLPLLEGTNYYDIVPESPDGAYDFDVRAPVYSADTAQAVVYDSASALVTVPDTIATLAASSPAGPYELTQDTAGPPYYEVDPEEDLAMSWPQVADYYMLSASKLKRGFTGFSTVGTSVDTLLVDTQCTLPSSFISQLDSTNRFDYLEVSVVPINGPSPREWDRLPSFDSTGLTMAFRSAVAIEYMIPQQTDTTLGKQRMRGLGETRQPQTGWEMVRRILAGR